MEGQKIRLYVAILMMLLRTLSNISDKKVPVVLIIEIRHFYF